MWYVPDAARGRALFGEGPQTDESQDICWLGGASFSIGPHSERKPPFVNGNSILWWGDVLLNGVFWLGRLRLSEAPSRW